MQATQSYPKCGGRMVEGHVVDAGYGESHSARWQRGTPEKQWWGSLKVDKKALKTVQSFRCERCYLLEHYAPD